MDEQGGVQEWNKYYVVIKNLTRLFLNIFKSNWLIKFWLENLSYKEVEDNLCS